MSGRQLWIAISTIVLMLLPSAVIASQSRDRAAVRRSPPTVEAVLAYLDQPKVVTKEQFQLWTGLRPVDGRFQTRWHLANGILLTNYMELAPGRLVIACWRVDKP